MRIAMLAAVAAGAMALSASPLAEKPVLVRFEPKFEDAVRKASLSNLPLLFVYGKDH